ncbi:uncharacterized protein I303_104186 [Kwoniella dejecticola CBS 10117]|uniref:Uncharacterized protein n=1 Tax=Kwoniella dejecticola CBS 10117 TaxID=1296121 RepID=A0A1A6A618_9TREE|nr:uncharacterized protein I303_04836 [Kwoniella dejecticola CBS 10117]OBR85500.1 hypothetical protein I303_04836 [Kwoniella dejecticola CBS 10117]
MSPKNELLEDILSVAKTDLDAANTLLELFDGRTKVFENTVQLSLARAKAYEPSVYESCDSLHIFQSTISSFEDTKLAEELIDRFSGIVDRYSDAKYTFFKLQQLRDILRHANERTECTYRNFRRRLDMPIPSTAISEHKEEDEVDFEKLHEEITKLWPTQRYLDTHFSQCNEWLERVAAPEQEVNREYHTWRSSNAKKVNEMAKAVGLIGPHASRPSTTAA